jgi:arylsulfatase
VATPDALPAGKHEIRYEFVADSPKPGTGGKSVLYVDGKRVAEAHVPKTQPFLFSGDEGTDVGRDDETAVSKDYPQRNNAFTGRIDSVTIALTPSATGSSASTSVGAQ